jgi:hypothetical protein
LFVYIKIYFYKKREQGNSHLYNSFLTNVSLSNLDSEALSSFGINLLIIISLGSTTIIARKISNIEPQQINFYPFNCLVYYNNFIVPGIIPMLMVLLIFKRNKALRKSVANELQNVLSNCLER